MKRIVIDGSQISNREELFVCLRAQLPSENFTGNNLDAFYDVLTECAEPVEIEIREMDMLWEKLGTYVQRLVRVLNEYQQEQEENERRQ